MLKILVTALCVFGCSTLSTAPVLADETLDRARRGVQAIGVNVMPAEGWRGKVPKGTWIVFFYRAFLHELGLDGGGWEVAIDPTTLNIIRSDYSGL